MNPEQDIFDSVVRAVQQVQMTLDVTPKQIRLTPYAIPGIVSHHSVPHPDTALIPLFEEEWELHMHPGDFLTLYESWWRDLHPDWGDEVIPGPLPGATEVMGLPVVDLWWVGAQYDEGGN